MTPACEPCFSRRWLRCFRPCRTHDRLPTATQTTFPRPPVPDAFRGLLDVAVREMGVSERHSGAGMTEQAGDHRHRHSVHHSVTGMRMTQVMQPHVLDPRLAADPVPEPEVLAARPGRIAERREHERALSTRLGLEDGPGLAVEGNPSRPGLGVAEREGVAPHLGPAQPGDLVPAARNSTSPPSDEIEPPAKSAVTFLRLTAGRSNGRRVSSVMAAWRFRCFGRNPQANEFLPESNGLRHARHHLTWPSRIKRASLHLGPSGLPVKSSLFPIGTLMPSAREGPLIPPADEHQGVGGVHPISPDGSDFVQIDP